MPVRKRVREIKTQQKMPVIVKYREALRLLKTELAGHEAFKVAHSLFLVDFVFHGSNSLARSKRNKVNTKIRFPFPPETMFSLANKLLDGIDAKAAEKLDLESYVQKLSGSTIKKLSNIISESEMALCSAADLSALLLVEELRDVLYSDVKPTRDEALSILFYDLFDLESDFYDPFGSLNVEFLPSHREEVLYGDYSEGDVDVLKERDFGDVVAI